MRMPASILVLLLGAAAPAAAEDPKPAPGAPAPKEEAPPADVPEEKAVAALEAFRRDFATEDLDRRLEALERLRKVIHPKVADLLMDLGFKHPEDLVRATAFQGLVLQRTSKTVAPRVAQFLSAAAKENAKRKARGDYGILIDRKTGEPDTSSPEGKEMLRQKRDRGRMMAEALKVLDAHGYRDREGVEVLLELTDDGNDDLVALALGMLGKWKAWSALKEMNELFDIYPKEDSYETGSVSVDTGAAGSADAQAAKRKWMSKFGDPDKRRARPKVVKALKQALLDITGQAFETPRDLREYRKRPEVKRRERA
jgi:hypothetical protein